MVINSPCLTDKKELTILGQTAIGKEFSNLLMADSLPKTILPTIVFGMNYSLLLNKKENNANGEVELTATIDGQVKTITKASLRRHLKLEDNGGVTTLPNSEIFKQLALMGMRPLSRRCMMDWPSSPRTSLEGGPGCHFTKGDIPVQAKPERLSNLPNEPPLREGNTSRSREGSMQLLELINLCTKLSDKVTSLEDELASIKAVYNKALITLTKRVKKLEKQLKNKRRRTVIDSSEDEGPSLDAEDSPQKGRMIEEIDNNETVNLVKSRELGKSHDIAEHRMESKHDDDDRTLAETFLNIKRSATKGKAIMQESDPPKKIKKKEMIQISLDGEFAKKAKQTDEGEKVINWNDLDVLRYHAVQNRPFSKDEVRKNMCTYLNNQGGYKMSHFKGMSYEDIRPIFERVWDQNQAFVPKYSKIEKEVMKRPGFGLQQESSKKTGGSRKKTLARKRAVEKQKEFAIKIESLGTKYPIVDWKTHVLTENFMYYQIIRADGGLKNYKIFSEMLEDFDRRDVMDLHRLVEERFIMLMDLVLLLKIEEYRLTKQDLFKWYQQGRTQEGLRQWRQLLLILWCLVMVLVMIRVIKQKKDQGVIDSGYSRHMTGNMSYLTDFEEIDGGYVAFGGNPKGGKITGKGGLTCLFAKATSDESELWHRRLGHINSKTMNKLVNGNLVRGLPSKLFENNQTCVACQKGKQHRASCKSKTVSSISQPLHMLHMDLFGPTFVKSLMKKMYCLVVTDDYSRFSWVFFLATKDETSGILKSFITRVENLIDQRVKVIRCDNGTEFKNKEMNQFCERKGIKREFSVARTPQQNGVAERKNRTLIEAARTMLADSKLPTTFWAEAANEGFFIGYSINSKAFRVFNSRTRIVEENLHVQFSKNTPNIARSTKSCDDAGKARMETVPGKDYILLPLWLADPLFSQSSKSSPDAGFKPS
ncbi:putative ribonuclease H-like domain-containing protein [Tanacetum coccineum]